MRKHKKLLKTIFQFIVLTLIVGFIANDVIEMTYATVANSDPDVILTINEDGKITQPGNLFGDELWYPDKEYDGVLRIENKFRRIKIESLGLAIHSIKGKDEYPYAQVYSSFIDNMKLTIKKGKLLDFNKEIISGKSFRQLLSATENEQHSGLMLADEDQFYINRNDFVDLKYTLYMDKNASDELESITSEVQFLINAHENPVDDDDDDDKDPIIEEPVVVIPDIGAHWAHDCIITLLNHRVIQGYPHEEMSIEDYRNGTVSPVTYVYEAVLPERSITRAEAAMLVGKALGLQEVDALMTGYVDIIPSWAKGYINATTEADIFEGYPFKLFKANNSITREEMIAVLTRAFEIKLDEGGLELPFTDKEEIAAWAEYYVKAGFEDQVIVGYPDNTYKPKANITRAEAFTIICKLMGLHDEHTQGIN